MISYRGLAVFIGVVIFILYTLPCLYIGLGAIFGFLPYQTGTWIMFVWGSFATAGAGYLCTHLWKK